MSAKIEFSFYLKLTFETKKREFPQMSDFSRLITDWYRLNKRALPWRETTDPYLIWISEIILQQTRVEQGLSYFLKFKKNYPTVIDLANADEMDILNNWQGLGYYSRARNLHFSAKIVKEQFEGVFPQSFEDIKKLKGVGNYTAAAISSFAFNLPHAVVDGNVYRLLSRVFDIDTPIDSTKGVKYFQALADELLDPKNPAMHNQAIMEVGAMVCTPTNPDCGNCPLNVICLANERSTIAQRPVKSKKTKVRTRYFHFLIYATSTEILLEKRASKDIWENMYQFPLVEVEQQDADMSELMKNQRFESVCVTHILSHQRIVAQFHHFDFIPKNLNENWIRINRTDIQNYPLPRLIDRYLEKTLL